jgi:hypothetical protein
MKQSYTKENDMNKQYCNDREQDDEDDEDDTEEEGTWQCEEEEYTACQVAEAMRECLTNELGDTK